MEIYGIHDGRFCKVWSIQHQCMKANINILERTSDMEVDELRLQNLAGEWAKTKLKELMEQEVDRRKSPAIFGRKKTIYQRRKKS